MPIKSELEHPRPGHAEVVAEGANIGRDQPQILGDEWQTGQPSLHRAEELGAWTHWPDCAVEAPAGTCQAAANPRKWSQADRVHVSQQRAQAVDAPAVAGTTKCVPVGLYRPDLHIRCKSQPAHAIPRTAVVEVTTCAGEPCPLRQVRHRRCGARYAPDG